MPWFLSTSLSTRSIISWLMNHISRATWPWVILGVWSTFKFCWPFCQCGILWATITIHLSHGMMDFFGICSLLGLYVCSEHNILFFVFIMGIGFQIKIKSKNVHFDWTAVIIDWQGLHCTRMKKKSIFNCIEEFYELIELLSYLSDWPVSEEINRSAS